MDACAHLRLGALLVLASPLACQPTATEVDACASTADCPSGQVCVNERCRKACNSRADCAAGEACIEGICMRDTHPTDAALGDAPGDASAGQDRGGGDSAVPDHAEPDAAAPDAIAPDTAARDQLRPDLSAPDRSAFDAGAVDAAAPDLLALDLLAPDLTAPDLSAPDLLAPDVWAPDLAACAASCSALGVECGTHDDGCGDLLDCGACQGEGFCLGGHCRALTLIWRTITAGAFDMGSPPGELGRDEYDGYPEGTLDETQHHVSLSRDFAMADAEVTVGDFFTVMGYRPSYYESCGDSCAVEWVSWSEAAAFSNALSDARSLARCFDCQGATPEVICTPSTAYGTPYECPGFRLPTEAEWEYAARAGSEAAFWSGGITQSACEPLDASLDPVGWYLGNSDVLYDGYLTSCGAEEITVGVHQGRQKLANGWELYDVHGNVWEWVLDCAHPYPVGPVSNPVGPLVCGGSERVFRGGGLGSIPPYCRAAERANYAGGDGGRRGMDIGFRPVRTLNP